MVKECKKKLGVYHLKSSLLDLRKSPLGPIFSRNWVFEELKINFKVVSPQFFWHDPGIKGQLTPSKIFFFSDHYKCVKMMYKVAHFSRRHQQFSENYNREPTNHSGVQECATKRHNRVCSMIGTTPGVIKVPKGAVFIRVKLFQKINTQNWLRHCS